AGERESRDLLQQPVKVVIVPRGVRGNRRMEEPALAHIDPSEELPVAFQIRVHHAIGGAGRKTRELLVELARAEQGEHHELVEIRAAALDADLLANGGMAAVAPD